MPLVLIEYGRGIVQEVLTIEIVEETCTAVQGDHDRLASKRHGTQRLSSLLLEGVVAGYPQHKISARNLCHREGDILGTVLGSNTGRVDDLDVLKIESGSCEHIAGGALGTDTDPPRGPSGECCQERALTGHCATHENHSHWSAGRGGLRDGGTFHDFQEMRGGLVTCQSAKALVVGFTQN